MDVLQSDMRNVLENLPGEERLAINSILEKHGIQIAVYTGSGKSELSNDKENDPTLRKLATHRGYMSVRKLKALTMEQIEADLTEGCSCIEKCLSIADRYLVLRWRQKYHLCSQGTYQQNQLFNIFRETKIEHRGQVTGHMLEGKYLCRTSFFKQLLKISQRTYYRIQNIVKSGAEYLVKTPREAANGDRGMIAVGYMAYLVKLMGDKSPESERILLPVGLTIGEMYKRYKTIYGGSNECIQESRFYSLWRDNFKNVQHLQRHSNFSTCNVCLMAKEVLHSKHPAEVHSATRKEWDEHLVRQQKERLSYYERRNEAVENPQDTLSLIIDGMDQAKTNIPHFQGWEVPKACDKSKLLQTHITGVLMHGITTYAIMDILQWPHDSNLTLNCLLYTLWKESTNKQLPRKLYIQLDNCARENKNKYFMGLMALMVLKGHFDEIWMAFLMVGHTHEDVDARFSKISSKLKKNAAKTLPEIKHMVETSIVSGMKPVLLPKVFNIKEWMMPVLNDIHNHTSPHMYRFVKDRQNHVTVKYKDWSTDEVWKPTSIEPELSLFKLSADGTYQLPEGIPLEVVPDTDMKQTLCSIQDNIARLHPFLKFKQAEWWKEFFQQPLQKVEYDENQQWYLDLLMYDHQPINDQAAVNPTINMSGSPLSIYMNKERISKKVYTGKKQSLSSINKAENLRRQQLQPGSGFLILFQDEDGEVGVGEVKEILHDELTVNLYHGVLHGDWKLAKDGHGNCCETCIKMEWIVDGMIFQLTEKQRLPNKAKNFLKQFF